MAGLASSGRPRDGTTRRRAPQDVTLAVPARRQGATATAAPREPGREHDGRANGPARVQIRGRPSQLRTTAGRRDTATGTPGRDVGRPRSSAGRDGDGAAAGDRESARGKRQWSGQGARTLEPTWWSGVAPGRPGAGARAPSWAARLVGRAQRHGRRLGSGGDQRGRVARRGSGCVVVGHGQNWCIFGCSRCRGEDTQKCGLNKSTGSSCPARQMVLLHVRVIEKDEATHC